MLISIDLHLMLYRYGALLYQQINNNLVFGILSEFNFAFFMILFGRLKVNCYQNVRESVRIQL